jgi:hypothetical protein
VITVSKAELARALDVNERSVTRWVAEGCPTVRIGHETRFVEADVRAWAAARGRTLRPGAQRSSGAAASSPSSAGPRTDDDGPSVPAFPSLDPREKARFAKDMWTAKQREHDHQQEKNLSTLGLDEQIREAKTSTDVIELDLKVAALLAAGAMKPQRGQALRQILAQALRGLQAREAAAQASSRAFLASPRACEVARLYDELANGWRRRWIDEALRAHLAECKKELPGWDADMSGVIDALVLDRMGEPVGESWPEYLPAPVVPTAKVVVPRPYDEGGAA